MTIIIIIVLFLLIVFCLAGLAWAMVYVNRATKDHDDLPPFNARRFEEDEQEENQ